MEPRIEYYKAEPNVTKAFFGVEIALQKCGLDERLLDLVKLRASQINGCAYCIDMHWKDSRHHGETEQRLYGLSAWEESPYYTEKERAALAWTEAVTRIAETHAPDAAFEALRPHFSETEIAQMTYAIATINAWNRMGISMRAKAGDYKPAAK